MLNRILKFRKLNYVNILYLAALIYTVHFALLFYFKDDEYISIIINEGFQVFEVGLASLTAFFVFLKYKNESKKLSRSWLFFSMGLLGYFLGNFFWGYYELSNMNVKFATPADIFYVIAYFFLTKGVINLPINPIDKTEKRKFIFDVSITFITAFLLVYYIVLGSIIHSSLEAEQTLPEKIFAVLYPLLDIVLLGVVLYMIYRDIHSPNKPVLRTLILAFSSLMLADLILNYMVMKGEYEIFNFSDILYVFAYAFFLLSSILQINLFNNTFHQKKYFENKYLSSGFLISIFPYIWLFISFAVLMHGFIAKSEYLIEIVISFGVIVMLISVRMIDLLKQNYNLTNSLQMQVERKSKELLLSEEKYKLLFESKTDAIFLIDSESQKIIDCNESFCKMYGYRKEEVINLHMFEVSNEIEKTLESKILVDEKGHTKIQKRMHKTKNGFVFPVEITASRFLWDNKVIHCIISRDITQRIEYENKLIDYNEKLKELNISKDKFFSIVAHDLRSPFGSILGLLKILHNDFDKFSENDKTDIIANLKSSSENIYGYLDNLLDWSRVQLGGSDFKPEAFDIKKTFLKSEGVLSDSIKKKNIRIINSIPNNTIIYADEKMILSVINNLLLNAVKFSYRDSNIIISSFKENNMFNFSVTDSGVGIPEKFLENLFKLESIYSTKGTEGEKGTGLGLKICKELIERNKGKIKSISSEGKGSTFVFTLPEQNY